MSDSPQTDQAFRADSLYGRAPEMTYSGAMSFLRRKYSRDLAGVDIAISGIPYDAATSFRPGARFGPAAIRAASTQLAELLAFPDGIDPFEALAVVDYGDCSVDYGFQGRIVEQIEAHALGILETGTSMLTFGGDHFVTYPLLRAHAKIHGPVALAILRGLGSLDFIGADVVEVSPVYDHAQITAIAAATIAHDYLVLMAKKKHSQT